VDARPSFSRVATILNQRGLHARAAAKFVKLANQYEAEIQVKRGELTANGRSIMGLMMLSAGVGNDVEVIAGVNLPMLIKLASVRSTSKLPVAVTQAQEAGRKYINVASQLLADAGG